MKYFDSILSKANYQHAELTRKIKICFPTKYLFCKMKLSNFLQSVLTGLFGDSY